jgi:hypothetical protein
MTWKVLARGGRSISTQSCGTSAARLFAIEATLVPDFVSLPARAGVLDHYYSRPLVALTRMSGSVTAGLGPNVINRP